MNNKKLLLLLFFHLSGSIWAQNRVLPIIPQPQNLVSLTGSFILNSHTIIFCDAQDSLARKESQALEQQIFLESGYLLSTSLGSRPPSSNFISLSTSKIGLVNPEAYLLEVHTESIRIEAGSSEGLFYGITTLEQLFPYGGLRGKTPRPPKSIVIPALRVEDYPQYAWRGMHLDVCRHFFPLDFIKRYLGYLAWCKLNVFHLHLTDSQGWRLEIKKYPKLTSIGAFRVQREGELFSEAEPQSSNEKANYGGFYTQDEIRELIRYAQTLHITIIPEIDMPGHSQAALVAYPQYSSLPGPQRMPSGAKGAYSNSFNPGLDSTYIFLQNILTEVMDLFPSRYIHVGGDEVDRSVWKTIPQCIDLVKRENLKSENELQSYFTKRIEKFIDAKGKTLIGWDEIIEGGIAPRATIMSWRKMKGGIRAVRENHDVVMAPDNFTYFDLYQGDPKQEPEAYSKLNLTTAYQFFPAPSELTLEERKHILGGEGTLWTETIATTAHIEYMLFPRLFALSESVWTLPQNKNWENFKDRLPFYLSNLESGQVNYAKSAYNVNDFPERDTGYNSVKVSCSTELGRGKIYYTWDGTYPSLSGIPYTNPFRVYGKKTLKLACFDGAKIISGVNEENFETSLSTSKEVTLNPRPSKRFPGLSSFVLTDGIRGTDNPQDGRWVGFTGPSVSLVLDLGKTQPIKNLGMDFLTYPRRGIYLPDSIEVTISENGKRYSPLVRYSPLEIKSMQMARRVKIYREFSFTQARYIRIRCLIPRPGPEDNGRAYILTDEIMVH